MPGPRATKLFTFYFKKSLINIENMFSTSNAAYNIYFCYSDIYKDENCSVKIGKARCNTMKNVIDKNLMSTTHVFIEKNAFKKFPNGGNMSYNFYSEDDDKTLHKGNFVSGSNDFFGFNKPKYFYKPVIISNNDVFAIEVYMR